MITKIEEDGALRVAALGGAYPWKWGEGPVEILTREGAVPGALSYGGIHTNAAESVAQQARERPLEWKQAFVFTGMNRDALRKAGVRPGLRVVLARSRRIVTELGPYVASYFLDDRADLIAWLLALEALAAEEHRDEPCNARPVVFLATTSEEVGGEGAQYYLQSNPTEIAVALEIGPKTPDADFPIDAQPTIWVP